MTKIIESEVSVQQQCTVKWHTGKKYKAKVLLIGKLQVKLQDFTLRVSSVSAYNQRPGCNVLYLPLIVLGTFEEVNDEEERLCHSEENDHAEKNTEQEPVRVASKEKHNKQGAEREQDVVGEGKSDAYGKDADQEAVSTCSECYIKYLPILQLIYVAQYDATPIPTWLVYISG